MGCGASAPAAAPAPAGPASAEGSSAEVAALPQETAAAAPAVSSLKSNSFMRMRKGSVEQELEALGEDVTIVVDVESFLESIQLEEYWPAFQAAGWTDMDRLHSMAAEDFEQMAVVKAGHIKKLMRHIGNLAAGGISKAHKNASVGAQPVIVPLELDGADSAERRCRRGSAEAELDAIDADHALNLLDEAAAGTGGAEARAEPPTRKLRTARSSYAELPAEGENMDVIAGMISETTPTSADSLGQNPLAPDDGASSAPDSVDVKKEAGVAEAEAQGGDGGGEASDTTAAVPAAETKPDAAEGGDVHHRTVGGVAG